MKRLLLWAALSLAASPPVYAGERHKALAGHYYLQGVMEVGSELLLKDDGSYQWFMAYGNVDQFSSGSWTPTKTGARLVPRQPDGGSVPVRLKEVIDWTAGAEFSLRRRLAKAEQDALSLRCPAMSAPDSAASPAMSVGWKPDPALAPKAAEALKPLEGLRAAAERAAALSAELPDDEARLANAEAAVKAFWDQFSVAMNLHYDAGIDFPVVAGPVAPPSCRPTIDAENRDPPESDWRGQQGVVVVDPQLEVGVPDVGIRLGFADGVWAEGKTDGRGFYAPDPQRKADVTSITISYSPTGLNPVTVPVSRKGRALVLLDFDYGTARPAFDEMILTRTPDGLKPEGYGQGIYVKGGH